VTEQSYIYNHLEVRPEELVGSLHWSIGCGDVSIAYFMYKSDALIALDAINSAHLESES
jgi:hypothetical protein